MSALHRSHTSPTAARHTCNAAFITPGWWPGSRSHDHSSSTHLTLGVVLESDDQEGLEGLHVLLEVAAQNCNTHQQHQLPATRTPGQQAQRGGARAYLPPAWTRPSARPPARCQNQPCSGTSSAATPSPRQRSAARPDAAPSAGRSANTGERLARARRRPAGRGRHSYLQRGAQQRLQVVELDPVGGALDVRLKRRAESSRGHARRCTLIKGGVA